MLEQPWSWVGSLWSAGADARKTVEQLKTVQDEVARLTEPAKVLAVKGAQREQELDHLRTLHSKDLENLELRLRLELSEKLRQLPPSRSE